MAAVRAIFEEVEARRKVLECEREILRLKGQRLQWERDRERAQFGVDVCTRDLEHLETQRRHLVADLEGQP